MENAKYKAPGDFEFNVAAPHSLTGMTSYLKIKTEWKTTMSDFHWMYAVFVDNNDFPAIFEFGDFLIRAMTIYMHQVLDKIRHLRAEPPRLT